MGDNNTLYAKDDTGAYVEYSAPALYSKTDTGEYAEHVAKEPTFQETLPEELRSNEHLSGVADLGALAKGYVELKGQVPRVPESPDKYEIAVPAGVKVDQEVLSSFRALAHSLRLPQEAVTKLLDFDAGRFKKAVEAAQKKANQEYDGAVTALKTKWGDQYDENLKTANKVIDVFGSKELVEHLKGNGLGRHPLVVEMFHNIGKAIGEDKLVVGGQTPAPSQTVGADGRPILHFPSMDKK